MHSRAQPIHPLISHRLIHSLLLALALSACTPPQAVEPGAEHRDSPPLPTDTTPSAPALPPDGCPPRGEAAAPLPGVTPRDLNLDTWLQSTAAHFDLDEIILTTDAIHDHNLALADDISDIGAALSAERWQELLSTRIGYLEAQFASSNYVLRDGSSLDSAAWQPLRDAKGQLSEAKLHVALTGIPLRCGPHVAGYYKADRDLRFDRNNCSTIRAQEVLEVVAHWPAGMRMVRTRYSWGWIADSAPLSAEVPAAERPRFLAPRRWLVTDTIPLPGPSEPLTMGTFVAVGDAAHQGVVATAKGFVTVDLPADKVIDNGRPLTRRAFLTEVFRYLGQDYGWGDEQGRRDCSRYVMDVLSAFGLYLPRHSAGQAHAGTFEIDVQSLHKESERLQILDAALAHGVVLLHFPGHIMLYLGRNAEGVPMAAHALADYVHPCTEGFDIDADPPKETVLKVDKITVSDLQLGRNTSRSAFIERLTTITVIGHSPEPALQAIALSRRAAPVIDSGKCRGERGVSMLTSPQQPHSGQPLRVIVTSSTVLGPLEIVLQNAAGERLQPALRRYGGPPYVLIGDFEAPPEGKWRVLVGDGSRVAACRNLNIARRHSVTPRAVVNAWKVDASWDRDMENLYAAFVEALFDYPLEEDLSWRNLHSLTQDPYRNILYDHLGLGEDQRLRMQPDCADLPYMLRAYFAWKMGLPFGYRRCSRGKAGRPPKCGGLITNLDASGHSDPVTAFANFNNRDVRNGVHSGSARTHPDDEDTDLYPIPLTRHNLAPGTTYADPYGHLLIVAGWRGQALDGYGILIGADAQPDGTIGRRRFWRGSFLFTPETTDVGAGFKAFRPVVVRSGQATVLTNDELAKHRDFPPFSREQYAGTQDDFYDKMESIINPRPLDPMDLLISLIDALEEGVVRRVVSVDNGEAFVTAKGANAVDMPTGYAIFETSGAWEDFSTPSRDMRLLISIDTVEFFPESVRRRPEAFGLGPDEVEPAIAEIQAKLDQELQRRTFSYTRSDGTPQQLSLQDIVARKAGFEMAYHPADCVEIRWAAPSGSDEMRTCKRRAPQAHRERMTSYRPWFAERRRPPR